MFWKYNKQNDVLQQSWTSTLYVKKDAGKGKQKQISHTSKFRGFSIYATVSDRSWKLMKSVLWDERNPMVTWYELMEAW